MIKYIYICFFLFLSNITFSQTVIIDSLRTELAHAPEKKKSSIYFDLCQNFFNINLDSAVYYSEIAKRYSISNSDDESYARTLALQAYMYSLQAKDVNIEKMLTQARDLAIKSKSEIAFMETYNVSGAYYISSLNLERALELFETNLSYSRKFSNKKYEIRSLSNIGAIYYRQDKLSEALENYSQAIKLVRETTDNISLATLLMNMASIYTNIERFDESLAYYKESLAVAQKYSYNNISLLVYYNLGNLYKGEKDYLNASDAFHKASLLIEKTADKSKLPYVYSQMGDIYSRKKKYDLAHTYIIKAIELAKKYEDIRIESLSYNFLSNLYISEKKYAKAEEILYNNLAFTKKNKLTDIETTIYWNLARLNYNTKRYKKAYDYKEEYISLNDSIRSQEKMDKLEKYRTRYESQKKELENDLLRANNELAQATLKERRYVLWGMSLMLGLLLTLIVLIFISYFKRGRLNSRLKILNAELEEINNTKDRFFSIMSHDLRSPFNSLIGFSNLIASHEKVENDEELSEYSSILMRTSENTLELLDSVLAWAKAQSGGMNVSFVNINIRKIIDVVKQTYEPLMNDKNISLVDNVSKDAWVSIDEDISKTILRNLISNAIKFTHSGGEIEIDYSLNDEFLILSIKDNGVGISQENMKKIFAIDKKISTRGTSDEVGTGFGLILIKDLAKLNGGDIWFESEEGLGSTFFVSFKKIL